MNIIDITNRPDLTGNKSLETIYRQFESLINELRRKPLPDTVAQSINDHVADLNTSLASGNDLKKVITQKQTKIINLVEKDLKIVPKGHYRNMWLAVGMSAFGLPIGVALGISLKNLGLLAIGLPIGMAIGMMVGTKMDKKAAEEGRQLDLEIKN